MAFSFKQKHREASHLSEGGAPAYAATAVASAVTAVTVAPARDKKRMREIRFIIKSIGHAFLVPLLPLSSQYVAHRQHTVCSGLFTSNTQSALDYSPKYGSQATHCLLWTVPTVPKTWLTGNTHGLLWTVPQNWMLAIPYYTSIGSCCKHLFRAPIFDDRSHTNVLAAVKCTLVCNEEPATSLGLARTVYVHRI